MEVLTIVLSGLLSLASSTGIIADSVAASKINSQIISIEKQKVRIDNSPSYSVAQGKLQKVRIATRGIRIKPDLRIEILELETDRVDLDISQLNLDGIDELRTSLNQPFQGALRLVLTEADLNRALQSPEILAQIQQALNRLIASKAGSSNIAYQLVELSIQFHSNRRLGVDLKLARPSTNFEFDKGENKEIKTSQRRELVMSLEVGLEIIDGKSISLTEPVGSVNGRPMSSRLLNGFARGISDRFNLDSFQKDGIFARILQLEIREDKVELGSFLKLETKSP